MIQVITCEIGKQGSTRSLSHIIRNIEQPKPYHKSGDRSHLGPVPVTKQPSDIGGVADDKDGEDDQHRSGDNERPATAEAASPAVAHVADERLDEESGERAA